MIFNLTDIDSCTFLKVSRKDNCTCISYNQAYITEQFLYYFKYEQTYLFSENFWDLCEHLIEKGVRLHANNSLFPFFDKKGYAPFDSTIILGLYKIPNLCTALFYDNGEIKYSFNIKHESNLSEREICINAIKSCFRDDCKNVILFSGGFDSTLIAYIAKQNGIKAELVNGVYSDDMSPNDPIEKEYSNRLAHYLDMDYQKVIVNQHTLSKTTLVDIIYKQPNTAHFSLIFNAINNYYRNQRVNFISGQQADSILNYGSTSIPRINGLKPEGYGELIKRMINMSNSKILFCIFKLLNKKQFIYAQPSIITGYRKFPIIKDSLTYMSIASLYEDFLSKCLNTDTILNSNLLFYVLSHISGSDASAILNCLDSIGNPLPFNDKELVYYYLNKNNNLKDKLHPKRIVHQILKEDPTLYKIISNKPNTLNISYERRFNVLSTDLILDKEYEALATVFGLPKAISYNNYHLAKCYERIFHQFTK